MPQKIYACTELDKAYRQSEIISGLRQYFFDVDKNAIGWDSRDYAIILSQDCDLEQDYNRRQSGKPGDLNGILVFEAKTLGAMKAGNMDAGQYKKVVSDALERYHFLQSVAPEDDLEQSGVPDLIIDFKRYFTISVADLDWQLIQADPPKRRARLSASYLEHLQARMTSYMRRVALPEPRVASVAFAQIALPAALPSNGAPAQSEVP